MAEAAAGAVARQLPKFKLGSKQVFLPDHVITFLHKTHLPPNEAAFQVPLTFTKFDLRDYLWNVYNVEVTKVRSYVKAQPLTQRPNRANSWYRPQSLKIMNVELKEPFQWPEAPTDLQPWSNELFKQREARLKQNRREQFFAQTAKLEMKSSKPVSKERKELSELAQKMLSGEVQWKNDVILDPKWDELVKSLDTKEGADTAAVKAKEVNNRSEQTS
ncbi:hypothetical protein NLU13_0803 [Sarocladium strictum]|uniref:Large ribosomal subunit protein uL23m n=1 Tax=Sarocladium strictum TaxID=5046 RepID=A0AA39GSI1_SARSR|nr:hypothetical protein NLU13_0803 [Sarocladium strictum]